MVVISLYSSSPLHLSLPPVDFLGNPLDACPIKALLEAMRGVVSWDDTIQVSFLHKCGQLIWCSAFNVVVTISFPDISSFHCWYNSATSPEVYLSKMVDSPKHSWGSSTPRESGLLHQSSLFSLVFWIRYAWNLQPFSSKAHNPKKVLKQLALTINFWFFLMG